MKFFKSLQLFLVAILIIGIATPLSTEAAVSKSGDLMKINKTVSSNTLVKGETTDVTLTVQGTPQDSTFVKPNDVVLIIDKSGSMQADNRLNAAKDAAKEFIDLMDLSKHELGIVDYSDRASSFPLTTDKNAAKAYVDTIQLGGGTNTSDAIRAATATLANKRSEAQPTIVIMTDGAANSSTDALAAAKAAKDAGITFYSIALLGPNENPDTSAPNKLLQEMASSFDHHHFVLGSVGLSDVYKAIVEEIGLASAYNVTITDTISPEFELVPGSYDNHIPRPTVNGNTISWFISELKTDELSFTYQVRAKANATAGKYTIAKTSSTFEIGDGSTYSLNTTNPIVEIKNHAPIITSIKEDKGHTTGGETVTITGQNFLPGVKVYFGSILATVVSTTDNEIIVTTPAYKQATVALKVENTDKQFATGSFIYFSNPTITSISPAEGPLVGGNNINISGLNYLKGAVVYINDVAASTIFADSALLRAVVPAATQSGSVSVKIVNPDNTSVELVDGYTYLAPPPPPQVELISLSPTSGKLSGGESILLNGKNFDRGVKVFFGDKEAVVSSFISSTSIRVTAPEGLAPGLVTVKVVNPSNTEAVLTDSYEYLTPPPKPVIELEKLAVTSGELVGGNSILVFGKNFDRNVKFYFGNEEAVVSSFISNESVRVIAPIGVTPGFVTVKAENPDGSFSELVNGYEYLTPPPPAVPEITSLSESSILVEKTKLIVIDGKNFTANSKIYFGNLEATSLTFYSPTKVTVRIPVSTTPGVVDVTIVNPDGATGVFTGGFTYEVPVPDPAPIIQSLSKTSGSMLGNELITITGQNFKNSAKVYFGNYLARVISITDTEIKIQTPISQVKGLVPVKVVNLDNQEFTLVDSYTYEGVKPSITKLSLDNGAAKGNYLVTIQGTNFNRNMTVTVAGKTVSYTYYSATQIIIRMPAGTPGVVDITVDIAGESATTQFTYN